MEPEKKITEKDFPLMEAHEKELIAKFSTEDGRKLLMDEYKFNNELQIFILNAMKKRKLTVNYIVGSLMKLSWSLLREDFELQMKEIARLSEGGR